MSNERPVEWIKKSDITDTQFQIRVTNNTTEIVVPSNQIVELVEISKKTVTLSVPIRSCATGQFLGVDFFVSERLSWGLVDSSSPKKPKGILVSVTARIDEETPLDKTNKIVKLSLMQFDVDQWNGLINEVEQRQAKLNQIVSNIRE